MGEREKKGRETRTNQAGTKYSSRLCTVYSKKTGGPDRVSHISRNGVWEIYGTPWAKIFSVMYSVFGGFAFGGEEWGNALST